MNRPLRILHIETRHRRGGAERNVLHTVAWEQRAGHDVVLAVGRDSLIDDIDPAIQVRLTPSLVREVNPARDLQAVIDLRGFIKAHRFDVVHTHQSKAGIVGRLAARGVAPRIVHTVHMASFGPAYGAFPSTLFLRAERLAARWTDVIVTVGDELRDMYVSAGIGRPTQYEVIHSPIDLGRYTRRRTATPEERAAARAAFDIASDVPVAIAIGSLEPRKRVDLVLRAVAPLVREQRLALVVAGSGPESSALTALATELGADVRFLGHVDDPSELMIAAEVLLHASTVEGVPQVVLQALAAGLPVVATSVIGLREIPDAPIVATSEDPLQFRQAVVSVLDDPPAPLAMKLLDGWAPATVDQRLQELHARIARR